MKSKLGKLKQLINNRGIHLKNPLHWIKLIGLGFCFIKKYGVKSIAALKVSYNNMQSAVAPVVAEEPASVAEPVVITSHIHAQTWERIKPTHSELTKMQWAVPNLKKHYSFTVIISNYDNDTVSSIEKQIYDKFEIVFGTLQETIGKASGDYVLFLQPGDFLHQNALFELCFELNRIGKTPPFIYFDHDYFVRDTVDKPYYKPGWSPDLLLVNNYINRACVFRRDLLGKIEIIDQPFYAALYDVMLKLAEFDAGHHKPGILLTMLDADDERPYDPLENIVRIEMLKRRGINGVIEGNKYGMTSLKRSLIGNPKISIIIPTCYTEVYIEECLKSIEHITTYDNYEIIIVDNSRKAPNYGEGRLKDFTCRILYVNEPFNWPRLNNLAIKEATGEILLFLNDDTEILTPDWLERMAAEVQRPEIGMVGPLVLYPNGTIYSSGLYIRNQRDVSVTFWYEQENSEVYHNLLHYTRPSLITHGVCFAVQKDKLIKSGGFDERFPIICNEIALSFGMRKNGYYNLLLSEVNIVHHVSASRKDIYDETDDRKRLEEIWGDELQKGDPYFNPYLNSSDINDHSEDPDPVICSHVGTPAISPTCIHKIIIVKLDHIGDVVLSLPAIRKLRKIFPNAQIDVLCGPWARELLEQQPEINNIHVLNFYDSQERTLKMEEVLADIKGKKYDLAINLRKYPDTKFLSAGLADYCLLLSEEAALDDISHSVPAIGRNNSHIVKWHFKDQLLSLVNTLEYDEALNREVLISSETCSKVDKIVKTIPSFKNELLIGMHVGSNFVNKKYPTDRFAILCDLICKKMNVNIILFGGPEDKSVNMELINIVKRKNKIISVAGVFSLVEFFHVVKKVDYFIGNDSGPCHIAGIQGVSTLVISGSRHSPSEWMPIGNSIHVGRRMHCGPCYDKIDCHHNNCLTTIPPAEVLAGLERLMILYPSKRKHNELSNV